MPKVKGAKAASGKKAKAAAKKKPAKRQTRKAPNKSASDGGFFGFDFVGQARQLSIAGAAGAGILLVGFIAAFWAGGYVGLLTERVDRAFRGTLVSAGLDIERLTLKGRRDTAMEDIEAAVGPVIGSSLLHFDLDAARARVEGLGWVRSAAVMRLYPDTVHVSIRERVPAAVWQLTGNLHLIDDNGVIIRQVGAYEYSSLPLIVGAGAPQAASNVLKALAGHEEIEEKVAALVRVGERRWNLRLRNKLDVKLPEEGLEDALEALAIIQAAHGTLDQDLEYIDLRDRERVIVRPRKGAAGQLAPNAPA